MKVLIVILLLSEISLAQSNFVRPSISLAELTTTNQQTPLKISEIDIPNQFDRNPLPISTISLLTQPSENQTIKTNQILSAFKQSHIGSEAIAYVLPVREGVFSNEIIKKRGMYSATDAQINALKTSENENFTNLSDNFGDIGLKQLNKIYVLLLHVIQYDESQKKGKTCSGTVNYYFIKVNNGIKAYQRYKLTPDSLRIAPWGGRLIRSGSIANTVSTNTAIDLGEHTPMSTLRQRWSRNIGKEIFLDILRSVRTVQPKSSIIINSRKEISARIGKKEGLKIDNRFYAYEQVYKSQRGKDTIVLKRLSALRVKKAGNNYGLATGTSSPSIFYKIAGRRITEGMLIIQKEDLGIGISLGYGTMQWLRFDYRIKGVIPGLKAYIALNDPNRFFGDITFDKKVLANQLNLSDSEKIDATIGYIAISGETGIEWAYIIASRLQFLPFIGVGYTATILKDEIFYTDATSSYKWKDNNKFFSATNISFGARAAINLSGNVSLISTAGYSLVVQNNYTDLKYERTGRTGQYLKGGISPSSSSGTKEFYNNQLIRDNSTKINGFRWDMGLRYEF